MNKRVKVDWDRWEDEDNAKDMKEEFDPDKLIDLMKRNGEWSDEEEEFNPEATEDPDEIPSMTEEMLQQMG